MILYSLCVAGVVGKLTAPSNCKLVSIFDRSNTWLLFFVWSLSVESAEEDVSL
jgi:hypothetical protein